MFIPNDSSMNLIPKKKCVLENKLVKKKYI